MNLSPVQHPNSAAAGLTGSLAALLIWGEGFWITVPPEIAVAQATILIAFVLGIGRVLSGRKPGK